MSETAATPVPASSVGMSPAELGDYLVERLGADAVLERVDEYGTHTVVAAPERYVELVELLRDDRHLAFDFYDCGFGVDEQVTGFSYVNVLYSTTKRTRLLVKVFAAGGREKPTVPSIAHVFEGANWMERETWDMFGIEFDGHPGLAPRILTVENFEGWPLRKDFHLASRVAKPWPGVKEPAETDEDGNVIEKEPQIGDAPGPMALDEIMAEQARRVNAVELPAGESEGGGAPSGDEGTPAGQSAPAAASGGGDDASGDEVQMDQETYDALIAEGKSERIARSKAKAAFVKKQRAAEAAGGDGATVDSPSTEPTPEAPAPGAPEEQPMGSRPAEEATAEDPTATDAEDDQ